MNIDINIMTQAWTNAFEDVEAFCTRAIDQAARTSETDIQRELSLALTDDAHIRDLNRTFRGKDKPTNVLSFPSIGPGPLLGDVIIAFETVEQEAKAQQKSLPDHTAHMLVHGFLHLLGYDHANDAEAEIMETLEIRILETLNIDNPYQIHEQEVS